jgi:hypothetical protein
LDVLHFNTNDVDYYMPDINPSKHRKTISSEDSVKKYKVALALLAIVLVISLVGNVMRAFNDATTTGNVSEMMYVMTDSISKDSICYDDGVLTFYKNDKLMYNSAVADSIYKQIQEKHKGKDNWSDTIWTTDSAGNKIIDRIISNDVR